MVLHPLGREREGLGTTLSPGTGMGGKRARSRPPGRCSGGGQGRTLLGIPAGGLRVLPSSPRSRSRFRRGLGQPSPEPARRAAGGHRTRPPPAPGHAPRAANPDRAGGHRGARRGDGAPPPSRFPPGSPDRFTVRPPLRGEPLPRLLSPPLPAGTEGLETKTQGTE